MFIVWPFETFAKRLYKDILQMISLIFYNYVFILPVKGSFVLPSLPKGGSEGEFVPPNRQRIFHMIRTRPESSCGLHSACHFVGLQTVEAIMTISLRVVTIVADKQNKCPIRIRMTQ